MGGTPGGSDSQIQYNNGGTAFGGATNFVFDDVNTRVGLGTSTPGSLFSLASLTANTNADFLLSGINMIYASSSTSTILSDTFNAFSFATTTTVSPPILSIGSSGGLPRVGIGTSTPGAMLSINTLSGAIPFLVGSSTVASTTFIIDSLGNVGVGTSSPGSLLSLSGPGGGTKPLFMISTTTVSNVVNTALIIDKDGKVGVGTTTPQGDLAVAGVIFAGGGVKFGDGNTQTAAAASIMTFRSEDSMTAGTTRFMGPYQSSALEGTESNAQIDAPIAFTASNLYVRTGAAPGAGKTLVVTLRKNSADTALTCTVSDTNTTCTDLSNSVTFVAGDDVALSIVLSAGATGGMFFGSIKVVP
ncbi:MAG: hypothetical protein HYW91_03635 [Candidatus Sungbacteria bacterium]|nr:hypothetical protein [Candidatus Sungbacteria bacterium]